jgi:putative DNA primase/helicase
MKNSKKEQFSSNKTKATADSKKGNEAIIESTNPNSHMTKTKKVSAIKPINTTNAYTECEDCENELTSQPRPLDNIKPPLVRCHVDVLDKILTNIEPLDWLQLKSVLKNIDDRQAFHTVERILETVDAENAPLVNHASAIHCYNGTHYEIIDDNKVTCFLIEAARQCGVPKERAMYQTFVRKITKQILINPAWRYGSISAPDTPFINLLNGTLFFGKEGHCFEKHSPQRFIRYCLNFNYDQKAKAPLWQKHLNRSLPNPDVQAYLAACLALPFYPGKIEKAPILFGRRDTGKSTTLDVYKALIGSANCTSATLEALTRISPTGDYHRSLLDGKLVNIASDIGSKFGDEGLAKMLISREPINVREMREQPFEMSNYARLMFALNVMPAKFFEDVALTKRAAVIMFEQRMKESDIQTGFAEQIIANELPGVLNWVLGGLDHLLKTRRLDPPAGYLVEMDRLRVEVDSLSAWLDERHYQPGNSKMVAVKNAYKDFVEFCKEDGFKEIPPKNTFTQRLRDLRYTIKSPNGHLGMQLYYSKPTA